MRAASKARTRFRRILRANETEAERRLRSHVRDRRLAGFEFVRQAQIGPHRADFGRREARLIVEADGSQYAANTHDQARDAWLIARGYRIPSFWNSDIMHQTDCIPATILAALPASPRLRGEDAEPLVALGMSAKGGGERAFLMDAQPLSTVSRHPRSARFAPDKESGAISPQAVKGEVLA
ncbi:DUF559 domain-containing protein [Methylobacterium sp. 37f]|uniref:endonuclease domain-containing protein n=1 Tax=Methylobacterium sp. 37f TaxID=2817058 RepID=UPI001FFD17A9|nr:DUF559 domain-containing protein [Methylobacterium sp. 37f]MCK2054806.1 DUF559 domain-containing protein [Methylobacterium sp. 37f]